MVLRERTPSKSLMVLPVESFTIRFIVEGEQVEPDMALFIDICPTTFSVEKIFAVLLDGENEEEPFQSVVDISYP